MFNILIVDDTKSVHKFVMALLSLNPEIKMTSVFNGQEALEKIKEKNFYDLILLDWEMPVMNGPETLIQLKDHGHLIPVVMMTTKNSLNDIETAIGLGAKEYLMKPFTRDILLEKIKTVSVRKLSHAS